MRCLVVFAMVGALAATAHAGRACEPRPLTQQTLVRGLDLAWATHQALEAGHAADGARVVVLARAGQDLGAYGVRYSHLGLAWRTPQGAWRIVHKLNDCGTAEAGLWRQGLAQFFLDDLWRHEAAWVALSPEVQARLLPLLADDRAVARLHERAYSMVAYPWATRYQQSNQWAIETLALAMEPAIADRQAAQAWLRFKGYQPASLRVGPLARLGARMGTAHIAFDDHPNAQRFADRIDTVTVDSVFDWLARSGLGGPLQRLALPGELSLDGRATP